MKKLLLSAIFICGVAGLQAQDETIRVEYEDMGKVRMSAAEYDLHQRQARAEAWLADRAQAREGAEDSYYHLRDQIDTLLNRAAKIPDQKIKDKRVKEAQQLHQLNKEASYITRQNMYSSAIRRIISGINKLSAKLNSD